MNKGKPYQVVARMKKGRGYVLVLILALLWIPAAVDGARLGIDPGQNFPSISLPPPSEETARLKRELAAEQRKSQEAAERAKTAEAEIVKVRAGAARDMEPAKAAADALPAKKAKKAKKAKIQPGTEPTNLGSIAVSGSTVQSSSVKNATIRNAAITAKPAPPSHSSPAPPGAYTDATTGMEFVFVKGGCFRMGDTFGDGVPDEKPVHEVCVKDYYLGKYEVTQGEWEKVMGNNSSEFKKGPRYPVEQVSWDEVQTFIRKLNAKSGKEYRLPTEAEWEYAARSGGKKERYAGTSEESELKNYAWYNLNSGGSTHEVGTKKPNGLGLYDMSGNVWEWTNDWYAGDYYQSSPRDNPPGPSTGSIRVSRGGSWYDRPRDARSALRYWSGPGFRHHFLGFRLALPPGQ